MWGAGMKGGVAKGATAAALIWAIIGVAAAETPVGLGMEGEEAFLDVLPKVAVPADVQPIPGAMNEPWRSCQSVWPQEYLRTQEGPEARAYRDIYGFVRAQAVIEHQDCGCRTKVASWAQVEDIAVRLRNSTNTSVLTWAQTKDVSDEADKLTVVAEVMCAGPF
ncbi:hypothetical protein LPB142_17685 (plasmid) [Rhodobacter xanthinilyticus]|uniref:Uncharacterized protein n=1 Tax=Rhodobacter xanthinilyticus TaxID=1850250 RepID=A0A1D9MHP7_9RHOB|nr:hypothetical protein [Rhodobacter xanthinilyticus]AOZ71288.1 hypothetical protein LPB142_17685 [Rhodobacter xanthinilyticus]